MLFPESGFLNLLYRLTRTELPQGPYVYIVITLVFYLFFTAVNCGILKKAGKPFWHAFIPFLNSYELVKLMTDNGLSVLFVYLPQAAADAVRFLMPADIVSASIQLAIGAVSFVFCVYFYIRLSKAFGKKDGFAAGILFLGFVFLPLLAFGKAKYREEPAPPEPTEDEIRQTRVDEILDRLEQTEKDKY